MSEAKPTPGPCYADGQVVHSDAVTCIAKFGDAYPDRRWPGSDYATEAHKDANAELFADALNVLTDTGLTPSQLVERVKELEEALSGLLEEVDLAGLGTAKDFGWPRVTSTARAALSKARPNTAEVDPGRCMGTRCTASAANGYAHSRECIDEAGEAQGWKPTAEDYAKCGPSAAEGAGPLASDDEMFEFWWADRMPKATQSEAWAEWCALRSDKQEPSP